MARTHRMDFSDPAVGRTEKEREGSRERERARERERETLSACVEINNMSVRQQRHISRDLSSWSNIMVRVDLQITNHKSCLHPECMHCDGSNQMNLAAVACLASLAIMAAWPTHRHAHL